MTILKANVQPEPPEPGALVYNGRAQALLKAGTVKGGTLYYAVTTEKDEPGDGEYRTDVPTAVNAGTYYAWYKVVPDANHNPVGPFSIPVEIARKPLTVTADSKIKTYGDDDPELTTVRKGWWTETV